jgi:Raf kinase inhibitor-like YbhB/YbcL family protein
MGRTPSSLALAAGVLALALGGCGGGGKSTSTATTPATSTGGPVPAPAPSGRMRLVSPAFAPGGAIPRRFTCAGGGAAPALRWSGVPRGTQALALVVEDLDVPNPPFVHWVLYDVPPTTEGLDGATPPPGAREARNGEGSTGWIPPCPPPGDRAHRYVFTLYALRAPLGIAPNGDPAAARAAIGRAAIDRGQVVGRFGR